MIIDMAKARWGWIFCFASICTSVTAQDALEDALRYEMTLEELMNIPIRVASIKSTTSREAPGIVTLITEEEIRKSGAQDLLQLLWLVPGFDFTVDVSNVVSVGIRGNGCQDGKALMLIDGQEMNENYFASTQFGGHISVDQIARIEIIRGPGSSMYGGFAEYGVINIITKAGNEANGISASSTIGLMGDNLGRRNAHFTYGKRTDEYAFNLSGFKSKTIRSNRTYTDFHGNSFDMAKSSDLEATNVNIGLRYNKLSFRGIADYYTTYSRDQFYLSSSNEYPKEFVSYLGELKYEYNINDKLTLIPKINFKRQLPWLTESAIDPEDEGVVFPTNAATERFTSNLSMQYNATKNISLLGGVEYYNDQAKLREAGSVYYNNSSELSFSNIAVYAQALLETRFANITLGARYDNHSLYSSVFVPRIALTKAFDKFHAKLLYSNSFRAPVVQNINFSIDQNIEPEKTVVAELELGYRFTSALQVNANLYDITTRDPIIYFYDEGFEGYANFNKMGTRGVELEVMSKGSYGFTNISYSFYTTSGKETPEIYAVPGANAALGYAPQKLTAYSSLNLGKKISLNPSLVLLSKRYGYATEDAQGTPLLKTFDPIAIANVFVGINNVFVQGLDVQIGSSNLFNSKHSFIQYYNSGHAPLPGASREYILKLTYHTSGR